MTIYQELGQRIKTIRVKQGLTQEELSYSADISTHFLSKIESGKEKASLETVNKLAKALKTPVATLFSTKDFSSNSDLTDRKIVAVLRSLTPKKQKLALDIFRELASRLRSL